MSTDYSGPTVNGALCSYARLSNYNRGNPGMSPSVPATTVSGVYVVPAWNHVPSYDTLNKSKSCSGYPTIGGAYGQNAGNCAPKYVQKPCM